MAELCSTDTCESSVQYNRNSGQDCDGCKTVAVKASQGRFCLMCRRNFDIPHSLPEEPSCCTPVGCEEIDDCKLVHVERVRWNPKYHRGYCTKRCTKHNVTSMHTYWRGRLSSSPEQFPYFVPSNWYRLSLQVGSGSLPDWGPSWHTLYHGTHPQNIHKILENGFMVRECQHGFPALYLSPSVTYSSHPRYARVVVHEDFFFQFVLEVRVDVRKLLPVKKRETLSVGGTGDIDPHFPNNENLEFLFKAENGKFLKAREGVVVTGVMVRKTDFDPVLLPSSWWWCKWRSLTQLRRHYYNGIATEGGFTD